MTVATTALLEEAEEKLHALYEALLKPGDVITDWEPIVTILVRAARMTFGTALEYEVTMASVDRLRELVRWTAQTIHQAHHDDSPNTFMTCLKNTCDAARQELEQ